MSNTTVKHSIAMVLMGATITLAGCATSIVMLDKEPKGGSLDYREIVYVDDGSCPQGKIKEVTGGNDGLGVKRKRRCIDRPE